jgi:hypothetical protein
MPFTCDKHGFILYGNSCLNCERERVPITPKITEQTHYPKWHFRTKALSRGEVLDLYPSGADAAAMAIAPLLPNTHMEQFSKWRRAYTSAIIEGFIAGRPAVVILGVDITNPEPKVENPTPQ